MTLSDLALHQVGNIGGINTSDATVTVGDILSGKTAYAQGVKIVGTMANQGAKILTPNTANIAIPTGYHNGNGYVQGDADLVAGNILSGKSIFGVNGSVVAGKRHASGLATRSSTGISGYYYNAAGSQYPKTIYNLTVSGLSFLPSIIIIRSDVADSRAFVYSAYGVYQRSSFIWYYTSADLYYVLSENQCYVSNGGFTLSVQSEYTSYHWYAWE